jgi:hypothetical protein
MKEKQVLTLAGVLLVVGVLVVASPSAAKRTSFDFWEVGCEQSAGDSWVDADGVLHGRGRVSAAVLYAYDPTASEVVMVGFDTVIGNADINLATGDGRVFGVFTLTYLQAPGSSTGTYDGTWDASLNIYTGAFSGRAVANGTGDLRHQKMRMSLKDDPVPTWLTDYLAANPPPCGAGAGIGHDTGFINHPNRD